MQMTNAALFFPVAVCAMAVAVVGAAIVRMLRYRAAWRAAAREIERLRGKMIDWPELSFYADANAALIPLIQHRVVFIGDSITQRWDLLKHFPQLEAVNRGIGWQTTSEILVRFRQDVINLRPAAVVILGGSNDFSSFSGPILPDCTQNNIQSMVELANQHGIVALVGTLPPVATESLGDREVEQVAFDSILRYNNWLRSYCNGTKCVMVDYDRAFREASHALSSLLPDGTHPNELGYLLMADVTSAALHCQSNHIFGVTDSQFKA